MSNSGAAISQMPMLTANVVTPAQRAWWVTPPENSSGEAATFPEALDTTNKEESLCTDAVPPVRSVGGARNEVICAGSRA